MTARSAGSADGDQEAAPGSAVATRRGDDGTTGLLFGGDRIAKDDPRTEAYGTVDEAVAALGMVRAEIGALAEGEAAAALAALAAIVLRLQRELFVAGAELAADVRARDRLTDGTTRVSADMVAGLDALLADAERDVEFPRAFVVPGETRVSASLEVARTIVRRAERRAVSLDRAGLVAGPHLLPYLNRLGDLLWVLARVAEKAEAQRPIEARPRRPAGRMDE